MYDITNRESYDEVEGQLANVEKHVPVATPRILVGNKSDLKNSVAHGREVPEKEAQAFADV